MTAVFPASTPGNVVVLPIRPRNQEETVKALYNLTHGLIRIYWLKTEGQEKRARKVLDGYFGYLRSRGFNDCESVWLLREASWRLKEGLR